MEFGNTAGRTTISLNFTCGTLLIRTTEFVKALVVNIVWVNLVDEHRCVCTELAVLQEKVPSKFLFVDDITDGVEGHHN